MDDPDETLGLTEEEARAALRKVRYPGLNRDIVALGLVRAVTVRDGRVHVSLVLASAQPEVPDRIRSDIRERLAEAGAVRSEVQILAPEQMRQKRDPWAGRGRLPGVRNCIAVGSGKGGVGKSTVAVNLALALHGLGHRVGVLDADIYGPSVPIILGLEDGARRVKLTPDRKIQPLDAGGVAVVSFGFFLGPGSPAVWRGPMVSKAVKQFSRGVLWPDLDFLVVDLPPGTGDVPLSLAQSIVVDGAVVVTTPQRLAVQEAEKAVEMFRKLEVPLLGVMENMSFSVCGCGRRSHPFGQGGGRALAERAGIPLLGEIPFEEPVMAGADQGASPIIERPDSAVTTEIVRAASRIVAAFSPAVTHVQEGAHE